MNYSFDPVKWALHQLPPLLRKKRIYALIRCLMIGIAALHSRFMAYASGADMRLSGNGFTLNLQRFLNDLFSLDQEIVIAEFRTANVYLHYVGEKPEDVYLCYQNEGDSTAFPSWQPDDIAGGFVIRIPASLETSDNIALIRKWVDYFKTAGTTYKIETYE